MAENTSAQDKRAAQREALRKQRAAELARQRRVRTIVYSVVTVVALVVVAGAGYLLYQAFKPEPELELHQPTSISNEDPYLQVGAASDAPVVDLVLDFMCPYCGQFEQVNGTDIADLANGNEATVRFHIRSFLNAASTTDYSGRAAGAAVCTYEQSPETFLAFQALLFENQPQEGTAGLSDAEMVAFARDAGATDATAECITNRTYQRWAQETMEPAGQEIANATPAVRINGEVWSENQSLWMTPGLFAQTVRSAGAGAASDSGQ
ncbi:MAG: thioredoxin domain-containing protein [Dermabacter sp.]|nr:thioredoxin domain-containing protein [Dermabacter sp.]